MPTHTLLGATGATGSAILRCLLDSPPKDLVLNIYVRSKPKLLKAFPALESTSSFKVRIFEAPMTDTKTLQECLRGAEVIHMCIAANASKPGCSIAQDAAVAVVRALRDLKGEQSTQYIKPSVLVLRASLVSSELDLHVPTIVYRLLWFALYYCYSDHEKASKIYETATLVDPGLLNYVFVDPPALFDAEGTERTGHRLFVAGYKGEESIGVNYADLGAAFVEIAEKKDDYTGRSVGVTGTGKLRQDWPTLVRLQLEGAIGRVWG
ncbi:hypothetical protein Q7P37_005824 [Cladosporium fusiforme]